jgi:hypothetical protein
VVGWMRPKSGRRDENFRVSLARADALYASGMKPFQSHKSNPLRTHNRIVLKKAFVSNIRDQNLFYLDSLAWRFKTSKGLNYRVVTCSIPLPCAFLRRLRSSFPSSQHLPIFATRTTLPALSIFQSLHPNP